MKRRQAALIGCLLFGAVFVVSTVFTIGSFMNKRQADESFQSLRDQVSLETGAPKQQTGQEALPAPQRTPQEVYGALKEENSDFAGWISIDGTAIDYPVMQTPEDGSYYLKREFQKRRSLCGVPFADTACDLSSPDSNVILYGHNMKDGTMFSALLGYESPDFFAQHPTIRFDTMTEFGVYQVAAVLKASAEVGEPTALNLSDCAQWKDGQAFQDFLNQCSRQSLYPIEADLQAGDHLLLLSTCEYSRKDGRLIVIAKEIQSSPTRTS